MIEKRNSEHTIFDQENFQKFFPVSNVNFLDKEIGNCQQCNLCMVFAYLSLYEINDEG